MRFSGAGSRPTTAAPGVGPLGVAGALRHPAAAPGLRPTTRRGARDRLPPQRRALSAGGRRDPRRDPRGARASAEDQTAVLYAPTFRDYLRQTTTARAMVDFFDVDARRRGARGRLRDPGPRARLQRPRPAARGQRPGIIDVTDYPEVSDLYLAADAAIVDYSSLRFDFGVTGKPMVFLVPDLQRYQETRGWLFDFEPTAPGPLRDHHRPRWSDRLLHLDEVREKHAAAYESSAVTTSTSTTGRGRPALRGRGSSCPAGTHRPADNLRRGRRPRSRPLARPPEDDRPWQASRARTRSCSVDDGPRSQRDQHHGRGARAQRVRVPQAIPGDASNPRASSSRAGWSTCTSGCSTRAGVGTLDTDPGVIPGSRARWPTGPCAASCTVAGAADGEARPTGDQGPAHGVVPRPLGGRRPARGRRAALRDHAAAPLRGVVEPDATTTTPARSPPSPAGSTSPCSPSGSPRAPARPRPLPRPHRRLATELVRLTSASRCRWTRRRSSGRTRSTTSSTPSCGG